MRRSDRLSLIVEIMQDGRLHLARDLASRAEVSIRTIYRDIDTLVASGVPIDGERGVGYLLREPVFLPPMALTLTELEALHLGTAIVAEAADPELQDAARSLARKIARVATTDIPPRWGFGVYPFVQAQAGFAHMPVIRRAIRDRETLAITYRALDGAESTRRVRPLQIEYWGKVWTMSGWCEWRGDFRAFRIDRITACAPTGTRFADEPGRTLSDYLAAVNAALRSPPGGEFDGDGDGGASTER